MPTYEYECAGCGERFDHFQSIKDAPIKKCSKCGKLKLKRLIGAGAGVIFKGSGFYTTDYRSPSYHSDKKSDSERKPESKTDSTAETSGKPAPDAGGSQAPPAPAPAKKSKSSRK
jgi:putative FmdB family regulatory protein